MGNVRRGGEPGDDLADTPLHVRLMEDTELVLVGRQGRRHIPVPGRVAGLLKHPIDDVFLTPRPGLPDPRCDVVGGERLAGVGRKLGA
jgi:hypothetical protein